MKGKFFLLLMVCLFFCLSQNSASAEKKQADVPALKLIQTHFYWGDTETIVSPFGVRIDNKGRMKYCLVAKSPDWKVTVFRDDDKTYLSQTLSQFEATGIISDLLVKKKERYFDSGRRVLNIKIGETAAKSLGTDRTDFVYIPLGHLAATQVESILYTVYKVPTNGGIPVTFAKRVQGGVDWMSGLETAGDHKVFLTTKKIVPMNVSKALFDAPKGYSLSKSMVEVLMSKEGREASGDFDVMFESKSGKKLQSK